MESRVANAPARRRHSRTEILCQGHTLPSVCPVAVLSAVERVKGLLHVQRNPADWRCSTVRGAPKRRCLGASRAFQTGCRWKPNGGRGSSPRLFLQNRAGVGCPRVSLGGASRAELQLVDRTHANGFWTVRCQSAGSFHRLCTHL